MGVGGRPGEMRYAVLRNSTGENVADPACRRSRTLFAGLFAGLE